MSIYVTGDTHSGKNLLKLHILEDNNPQLTKDDYVIITGDFGGVWNKKTLKEDLCPFEELPFTVLFVDGNHENFDLLNEYPVTFWKGGKVHKIADNVIHLMRGQVFTISGKTFFTFGGATSTDKAERQEGVSWWHQEMPTCDEFEEGIGNLKLYNNEVDYIITHSCGEKAMTYPPLKAKVASLGVYPENQMLTYFEDGVKFRQWYFGHYHEDAVLSDKYTVVWQAVLKID